jgi:hypothetical protein
MPHLRFEKPESIAKERNEIQIVDTFKTLRARTSIGFARFPRELNRTLLSLYTFEIFLNSNPGNTTPDAIEFARILSPVAPPAVALKLPANDLSPSIPFVTAPQASVNSIQTVWVNNLNAAPFLFTNVYAEERSPKGATSNFSVSKWNYSNNIAAAYSLDNRPTTNTVTTGSNPSFPSLGNGVAGDYREIGGTGWQGRARMNSVIGWNN